MWPRPRGHAGPPHRRFHRTAGGGTAFEVLDPRELPLENMVALEAPKGTCIVLHGLLPTAAAPTVGALAPRLRAPRHRRHARYHPDNWLRRGPELPLRGVDPARSPPLRDSPATHAALLD